MHHIHISTGFLSVVLLFVFGIVTMVLLSSGAKRREWQNRAAINAWMDNPHGLPKRANGYGLPRGDRNTVPVGAAGASFTTSPLPYCQERFVQPSTGTDGLLTGVLLGEALGGGFRSRETVNNYYDSAPSSYEPSSGASWSDSGSSSDSSSGGFDVSW